jgi:hypothetical protein
MLKGVTGKRRSLFTVASQHLPSRSRDNKEGICQKIRDLNPELNPDPPYYEAYVLPTRL